MKNGLGDLNNILFETLENLNDREIKGDDLKNEIERSKAIVGVTGKIIENATLQLDAIKFSTEYGKTVPDMFIEDKNGK